MTQNDAVATRPLPGGAQKGVRGLRLIGITGGIGAGKSTVSALYRAQGVPVIDADAISRALTAPGGEALEPIRDAFGEGVFHADGTLNRAALAAQVFMDDAAPRARLNAIMHPMITERVRQKRSELSLAGAPVAILDAPLLFETGMDRLTDAVICVTAPEPLRVKRVCGRDRISAAEAIRRIRSQNPAEHTEALSDYILSSDAPLKQLRENAAALWQRVLADGPRRTPQGW